MTNEESTTAKIDVTFYDNFVPALKAGEYTVTASQALTVDPTQTQKDGGDASIPSAPHPDVPQTFIVRGPRFALDPADIHRVFPPDNGVGAYEEYLPMIVFNKRALPWERELLLNVADKDTYPWVALLLFTDDELLTPGADDASKPPPGSQQNPTRTASFPLKDVMQAPPGTLGPAIAPEDDEDPASIHCNVIEISVETFTGLMPTLNDLRFLAHARQVATDHKEPLKTKHEGWFSVVCGNRFPVTPAEGSPGRRNIAHLVSLEGFEKYLGIDAPANASALPSGASRVRLISLASWSFTCLPDPRENFRTLMLNLISEESEQGTGLLLRMPLPEAMPEPYPGAQTAVLTRLRNGYVPLSYATRSGEKTFAWYRGPLAPVVTENFLETTGPDSPENLAVPLNASQAMLYDPATGLFDHSYAVAFQTGRSLALASLPFATNLLQWRRAAHGLIDLLMEYLRSPHLKAVLQGDQIIDENGGLTDVGAKELAELLDANLVSDAFKDFLATGFADNIAGQIGQAGGFTPEDQDQQPGDPATLAPPVPADLSRLMQHKSVIALLHQLSGLEVSDGGTQRFDISDMADQVVTWLARTALLYGVPFSNLVSSERMLPKESIRFFYVDQNWIDSLLDGALSVGLQSSRDSLFHQLIRDALHRAVDGVLHKVRDRLRNVSSGGEAPPPGAMAGFVLRSAVVSGWPGLEAKAYSDAGGTKLMKPLRLDRVSPEVMIGLYPDVPGCLELNEPSEGLVWGCDDEGIALRYLPDMPRPANVVIGQKLAENVWLTQDDLKPLKRSSGVLQIAGDDGLVGALRTKYPDPKPTLSPASLAVLMVRVPEQMLFQPQQEGAV